MVRVMAWDMWKNFEALYIIENDIEINKYNVVVIKTFDII